MSDSKVIVFGSFTEDETRSLLQRQSSGNAAKPVEKKNLQFGSLNLETGITFGNFDGGLAGQLDSANEKIIFQHKKTAEKVKDAKKIATKAHNVPGPFGSPKENGSIDNSTGSSPICNGVKDLKIESTNSNSLQLFHTEDGLANRSQSSDFDANGVGGIKDSDQDVTAGDVSVPARQENIQKATNGAASVFRNILPRGLINSGNLCFLNATLQALLSCSPFVQLLQELRVRKIPKVGFPTLAAFAAFIIDFDLPSNSSLKKDTSTVEAGRPFSPAMFEGVLKNFTPDVPSSLSGRPRQEDAQEFLSFIMDRMHDELLKLEGQPVGINGAGSSLVSSAEDDEWETVGPKNKSAVTRTQSFIPSALSDIFGGQLSSVVKARGMHWCFIFFLSYFFFFIDETQE
uniref:ubiquitinyl hydrolase 1 n=1 Tax=Rhizophora mucronata TaxID=61149 RepID=A0A2P2JCX4_RHIMU